MSDIEKGPVYTVETISPTVVSSTHSPDSVEDILEHDSFCGISFGTLLCLAALGGLLLDILCCYLAMDHVAVYGFALSAVCSLVCFCTSISCIQEEKAETLARTAIWPVIKFLVMASLYFCATVFFIESLNLVDDSDATLLTLQQEVLLAVLPVLLVLTLIHWQLTKKASVLLFAKNKFYMIENDDDANTSMRASLRLYLAAAKLQNYEKF